MAGLRGDGLEGQEEAGFGLGVLDSPSAEIHGALRSVPLRAAFFAKRRTVC